MDAGIGLAGVACTCTSTSERVGDLGSWLLGHIGNWGLPFLDGGASVPPRGFPLHIHTK